MDVSECVVQISEGLGFLWGEHASAFLSKRAIRNSQIHLIKLVNNRHKKRPPFRMALFLRMGAWRCATLTWGIPTLPSPLTCFTAEFGMGSGGATSLWPPSKKLSCRISFHILRKEDYRYAQLRVKSALLLKHNNLGNLIFNQSVSNSTTLTYTFDM